MTTYGTNNETVNIHDEFDGVARPSPLRRAYLLLVGISLLGVVLLLARTEHASISNDTSSTDELVVEEDVEFISPSNATFAFNYGVIMDLGSTGSRIFVYRWQPAYPLRSLIQLAFNQIEPGVSFFARPGLGEAEVMDRVSTSLLPLLSFAVQFVPPAQQSTTSIRAKATAGVRLLPLRMQQVVMQGVQRALSGSGFQFKPSYAHMITGAEEALLDWISINAALGLLHLPQVQNGVVVPVPTVGAMDIGGGSAQLAYAVNPVEPNAPTEAVSMGEESTEKNPVVISYGHGLFHLRLINGLEHTVYAVSRLNYGMQQALIDVISADIDGLNATNTTTFSHPCVLRDVFFHTLKGRTVSGAGNAQKCYQRVEKFFKYANKIDLGNVSYAMPAPPFRTAYQPFLGMDNFAKMTRLAKKAISDYNAAYQKKPNAVQEEAVDVIALEQSRQKASPTKPFTINDLAKCMNMYPAPQPELFLEGAQVICQMPWAELQARYGDTMYNVKLSYGCFGLVYMNVLLNQVYKFHQREVVHVASHFVRCPVQLPDVDTQFPFAHGPLQSNLHATYESSWALGGMVYHIERAEQGQA